jgi:hypothetical protein
MGVIFCRKLDLVDTLSLKSKKYSVLFFYQEKQKKIEENRELLHKSNFYQNRFCFFGVTKMN